MTDLTRGHVLATRHADPVLTGNWLRANARDYAPGADLSDPLLSPVHADAAELAGLPPVLVHVAEQDLLHDEGVLLAERLRAAGVTVDLVEHPGLWHVHHVQAGQLRAADESLAAVGAWLRPHVTVAS
ncbi:MAG: alpha/beta hydrolase fold domain-containing protein [Mycobacteriales bacterium]|nr:alpha/beta hydrolase fold domain-containing protein [Mycobacteriales bacterium]